MGASVDQETKVELQHQGCCSILHEPSPFEQYPHPGLPPFGGKEWGSECLPFVPIFKRQMLNKIGHSH